MVLYNVLIVALFVILLPQLLAFTFVGVVMCLRATRKHDKFDDTEIKGQVQKLEDKQVEVQGEVKEIRGDIAMKALNVMLVHEKEPKMDKSSSRQNMDLTDEEKRRLHEENLLQQRNTLKKIQILDNHE